MSQFFERDCDVSSGWFHRLVFLWEEDDSGCHDRERLAPAFWRITGRVIGRESTLAIEDRGDWTARLHSSGWVTVISCQGSAIAVVVRETSFKLSLAPDAVDRLYALAQSQMFELKALREQIEQLRKSPSGDGPHGGS